MRAASPRQPAEPPPACPAHFPPGRPGAGPRCLCEHGLLSKEKLPDSGSGVEGLPLAFSLTFSCLTKDRPCLGFLLCGSWRWMEGTSLFEASGRSPLSSSLPHPSGLSCRMRLGEGLVLEMGVGESVGLPLHSERGLWRCGRQAGRRLAQGFCTGHC